MDSDERSGEESDAKSQKTEESNEEANKSEEEGSHNQSQNESEKSQEANDNPEEEQNKKQPIKFDDLQLVLTNEVKIDVLRKDEIKENELIAKPEDTSEYFTSKKNTYNLLSEVNNDLDELFNHLSRTIKSFNENQNQTRADSPVTEHMTKKNYSSKGVQSPSENIRNFTEKETNTSKLPKSMDNNKKQNKTPKFQLNRDDSIANNLNNLNYKLAQKGQSNNYMRTVDDLYRHRNEPVIYSSSHRVNKKNYAGESDGFECRDWRGDKQIYKPKDILHAMDILLDKDD
jgi:hypothetical protein